VPDAGCSTIGIETEVALAGRGVRTGREVSIVTTTTTPITAKAIRS
jgi:hypothetical protein